MQEKSEPFAPSLRLSCNKNETAAQIGLLPRDERFSLKTFRGGGGGGEEPLQSEIGGFEVVFPPTKA